MHYGWCGWGRPISTIPPNQGGARHFAGELYAKPGNEDLAMAGPLMKGAMLATEVAMGMRKGETDLKEKFDAAIKSAAADGVIKKLSEKWSKLDLTPSF